MAKTKEISLEVRTEIVTKFKCGISAIDLSKMYNISRQTVYNLVQKKNKFGTVENKSRSGRKRSTNKRQDRLLLRAVAENPGISYAMISSSSSNIIGENISARTVRRRCKDVDVQTYMARKVIDISPENMVKRIKFAEEYIKKPLDFWKNVLWTDESSFQYQGSFRKRFMHLPKNLRKKAIQPHNRHGGGSIMFWGCICYYGLGELAPIQGSMNQVKYLDVLNDYCFTSANTLFPHTD